MSIKKAVAHLRAADPAFAAYLEVAPECELGKAFHESEYETLVFAVIGQQISGKAADTITNRLVEATGRPVLPEKVLSLGEQGLRDIGFSRSKARTVLGVSDALLAGDLDFDEVAALDDAGATASLSRFWGIGRWTAEMLMIFRLGRLDVWPTGDLGVRKGWAIINRLTETPTAEELESAADHLRPYRSIAAWYCWAATREETAYW